MNDVNEYIFLFFFNHATFNLPGVPSGYQFYPESEILSEKKRCGGNSWALDNFCDGSYDDCLEKGVDYCNNKNGCFGVQIHRGWTMGSKSPQFCGSREVVPDPDISGWNVYIKMF